MIVVVEFPRMIKVLEDPLELWAGEPEYAAEIVRAPTAVPVSVTEQLDAPDAPAVRAQEAAGLNASPGPVEDSDTVPAGLDLVPAAVTSVTLMVTVPAWPARSGLGETDTAVAVARLLTSRVRPPLLVWRIPETPAYVAVMTCGLAEDAVTDTEHDAEAPEP